MGTVKADDLAGDRSAASGLDQHPRADRHGMDRPRGLDHQAADADDPSVNFGSVEFTDLFRQGLHDSRAFIGFLSKRLPPSGRFNLVFTRVVNHYDIVLVTLRTVRPTKLEGRVWRVG